MLTTVLDNLLLKCGVTYILNIFLKYTNLIKPQIIHIIYSSLIYFLSPFLCEIYHVTQGTHTGTIIDTWGLIIRDQHDRLTNDALHPTRQAQFYGVCRLQDQSIRKPPIKWLFYAARHPTILVAITPDWNPGRSRQASATPPRWGQRRWLPSACGIPPRSPPQRRPWHALWGLPGLGASKFWKLSG